MTPVDLLLRYQKKILVSMQQLVGAAEHEAHSHPEGSIEFLTGHTVSNLGMVLSEKFYAEYLATKELQGRWAKDPVKTAENIERILREDAARANGINQGDAPDAPQAPH